MNGFILDFRATDLVNESN